MLLYGATPTRCSMKCPNGRQPQLLPRKSPTHSIAMAVATAAAAAALVLSAGAVELAAPSQSSEETLSNIPQTLSSVCSPDDKDCKKRYKIQRPKSRKAESCTGKCVGTCIQEALVLPAKALLISEGPLLFSRILFGVVNIVCQNALIFVT